MTSSIDKHEMKKLKMISVKSRTLGHLIKFKGTMLHPKTFLGNGLRCNRERYMNTDIFLFLIQLCMAFSISRLVVE